MSLEVCWAGGIWIWTQEHSQIFEKAAPVLVKLSKDTFGNFLIQMLLDSATEEQVLLAGNGMKWIDMGGSFWRVSFEPIRKELPRACSLDLSYRHATSLIVQTFIFGVYTTHGRIELFDWQILSVACDTGIVEFMVTLWGRHVQMCIFVKCDNPNSTSIGRAPSFA